jgi:glycosyltransferase 2 family protein
MPWPPRPRGSTAGVPLKRPAVKSRRAPAPAHAPDTTDGRARARKERGCEGRDASGPPAPCSKVPGVTAEQAPPKRRSGWGTAVRAAATLAIVVFVFTRVPLRDLGDRFTRVGLADAALLVVVAIIHMATGAVRWRRLLVRLGERIQFVAIARDILVGALFNTFLPTSFGGDVIRAIRTSRRLTHGYRAWSSSLFERLIGMLTLAIAGAIGVVFAIGDVLPPRQRILVVGMAVTFAFALFFVSAPLRVLVRLLEKRLPSALIADIRGVVADLEGPLATAPARLETFAWSALALVFNVAYTTFSARALGAPEHSLAVAVGLPIVSVLSLAPVSLGGHGLREGLFVVVLGVLGVPKDVALGIALLALAYNIFFALVGGIVALVEPTAPLAQKR